MYDHNDNSVVYLPALLNSHLPAKLEAAYNQ